MYDGGRVMDASAYLLSLAPIGQSASERLYIKNSVTSSVKQTLLATTQKTAIFILTTVRSSNPTIKSLCQTRPQNKFLNFKLERNWNKLPKSPHTADNYIKELNLHTNRNDRVLTANHRNNDTVTTSQRSLACHWLCIYATLLNVCLLCPVFVCYTYYTTFWAQLIIHRKIRVELLSYTSKYSKCIT